MTALGSKVELWILPRQTKRMQCTKCNIKPILTFYNNKGRHMEQECSEIQT